MKLKIWNRVILAGIAASFMSFAHPAPAAAGDVSGAVLSCFVDTYAYDEYTQGACFGAWTPSTASNPSSAVFEVFGLPAGSYTFTWSQPSCGNYPFCSRGIYVNSSVQLSVQIRDNATNATKVVSARARYFDGWN